MRCFILLITLFASVASGDVRYFPYPIEKAILPEGLTESDEIKFAIFGRFVSSLYRAGTFSVQVDEERGIIYVEQTAYTDAGLGLTKLTSFAEVLNAGRVSRGSYTVVDRTSGKTLGALRTDAASFEKETYAKITDVSIQPSSTAGRFDLVLLIELKDRCSGIRNIEVSEQKDSIVVTPFLETSEGTGFRCGRIDAASFRVVQPLKNQPEKVVFFYSRSGNESFAKILVRPEP